ncbi:proteinase inhibitor [Ramlibacter rhizophilus]|uniref:Proteinase inhibitor n=2 Tax=Ramlibacter rhizophilus TaxID=1781167 RepID=A0A4Z0BI95_9BURK|nr:proteinase inhibitor [Ramlibacter rhizophilus]
MPHGKPAGVPCVQLDRERRCQLFGRPERPAVCAGLQPSPDMCGNSRKDALLWLAQLEHATRPAPAA